ncbi:MAG: NfeD family protein [Pseudolysinimonas sp.]|jgi:membrane protein implicated in regulation of membrane protease activity|uniref:NfeD family protein n=1 Tax=Pseudolysinimonas sp. TaxID=2680009 RepID=UPI003C73EB5A
MSELLVEWGWVLWLALVLVFVIIEVFTLDFTFLMLAGGSLGGLVAGFFPAPIWAQVVIAGVLALLLLFVVRPPLLRAFRKGGDPTLSNVAALPGLTGTVVKDFADARGQVKLANGETWTSRLADGLDGELVEGERVVVTAIEGATAVVVPASAPQKEGLVP